MFERQPLRPADLTARGAMLDEGLRRHMLRVYNYMASGVLLTGIVALFVASTPALHQAIFGTPLNWVAMFAPLAFVFFFTFRIEKLSASAAQASFWAFSALMGLSLSSVFLIFTGVSIAQTFFITAVLFLSMSVWGYTTGRDLSKMGSFLFMGIIGIVLASIVNIFLGSTVVQTVVSIIGVVVFTGLTAWDTQNIKSQYAENYGHEANSKLAVFGALSLYLNFVNLFQMLLTFTGQQEE